MDNVPVTIIVKAPNQQIEDVQIQCELSWTIKRLKGYLSEVYPSKPRSDEQKLIYSGQLLNDTVTLKDVLRQYEGQDTHTVHLVFTPKNQHLDTNKTKEAPKQIQIMQNTTTNSDGLRHRNIQNSSSGTINNSYTQMPPNLVSSYGQLPQNVGGGSVPYPTHQPPSYEYIMAQQLAMQQFYMQYMNQYMNVIQQANNPSSQTTRTNNVQSMPFFAQSLPVNNPVVSGAAVPPPSPPPVHQPQPHQPPQPGAAAPVVVQPAAVENNVADEGERLDWLDMFYVFSRLMVLVTLVYVYSSPVRFMIVIFFTVLYYLYHIGFFRQTNQEPNNNNHNLNNNRVQLPNEQNNANNNQQPQQQREQGDAGNGEAGNQAPNTAAVAAPTEEPPENSVSQSSDGTDAVQEQNNRLPVIALLRTFVLSFFASLIPETPAL